MVHQVFHCVLQGDCRGLLGIVGGCGGMQGVRGVGKGMGMGGV